MEGFFTQAATAVELFGFSYLAGSFALHAHRRIHQDVYQHVYQRIGQSVRSQQQTISRAMTKVEVEPQPPKPKRKLSPTELLRQQCQQAGVKWRDAHGKNKHLKKAEMIAALEQLERSQSVEQPTPQSRPPKSRAA